MSQSRRASALESVINVLVGYSVAVLAKIAIFPLFGMEVDMADNLAIGALFTVISLVRSYCLRRLFNHLAKEQA